MASDGAFPVTLVEPTVEDRICLESPPSNATTGPGFRGRNSLSMGIGPLIRPRTLLDIADCVRAVSGAALKGAIVLRVWCGEAEALNAPWKRLLGRALAVDRRGKDGLLM